MVFVQSWANNCVSYLAMIEWQITFLNLCSYFVCVLESVYTCVFCVRVLTGLVFINLTEVNL